MDSTSKMVRVWWRDAHAATQTWSPVEEIDPEPCIVVSVGFVLSDVKPDHVVLAQSFIDDQGEVDHVLAIPSAMVVRVESLHTASLLPVEPPA